MNNYSTEQLQKIVDDAPEGATDVIHIKPLQSIVCSYPETIEYSKDVDGERWHWNQVHGWFQSQMPLEQAARLTGRHSHIKLSDIRAELLARPKFKVGDLVVVRAIQDFAITDFDYKALHKIESFATLNGVRSVCLDSFPFQCYAPITIIARATAEEIAAGHRIDEPSAVESIVEFIANPSNVQADTITTQLDPAKCRVVDPTVYDAPTDSPRDDFDAMSESHRSPACKCQEFPFDAELEVPVVASQQQIGGDHYTKLAIQPMHYSMANKLNPAQHTIIKYVTRYPDKDGIQDLLKARHTIDLLIERLKGERGE